MKKKTAIIISVSFVLVIAILISIIIVVNSNSNKAYNLSEEEVTNAYDLLYNDELLYQDGKAISIRDTYYDYLDQKNLYGNMSSIYGKNNSYNATLTSPESEQKYDYPKDAEGKKVSVIGYEEKASYSVEVSEAGYYNINADYYVVGNPLTNFNIKVDINGVSQYDEAKKIVVPVYWIDPTPIVDEAGTLTKKFSTDIYRDEIIPKNIKQDTWNINEKALEMHDNGYSTTEGLLFYFESGTNTIDFTMLSSNGKLALGDVTVNSPSQAQSYADYISGKSSAITSKEKIEINAINYVLKNSSYIRMASLNDCTARPFSNDSKKLNIIDGDSWNKGGQELTYTFTVEQTGLYDISFHYRNNKNEFNVFRNIYLDGAIPFAECMNYEFPYTGNSYANHTLGDENGSFKFYLEAGSIHTLTLGISNEPLLRVEAALQLVVDHINSLALEVLKVTGTDIDENRDLKIMDFIPKTEEYLRSYDILLKSIADELASFSDKGSSSATIAYIQRAISLLEEIMQKPSELQKKLDRLYTGTSSANQLLGDTLENLSRQPLFLEHIYVTTNGAGLPAENSNFFESIGSTLSQLWQTFTSDRYSQTLSDDSINIWVSRPLTYINIMQEELEEYNATHDVKVKLSAMPDAGKLTYSIASNKAPDIVLGIQSYVPYDLALRGGVYDLTQFEDFWEIADRFPAGLLLSFLLSDEDGDAIYGIPETVDFNAVAYRSDIMTMLGLNDIMSDLDTWEDMIGILPSLQRYGMNYYMPISAEATTTKWYYQTTPMILQNGGTLYTSDGTSVNINTPEAIKGLDTLTKLFTERALDTSIPLFYSQFRSGSLPMGTVDFSSYIQLKNAAPEIAGKWKLTLPLGTERTLADGTSYVDRTYIASATSCAIMEAAKNKDACWEFLKWWTSKEVQTQFSYSLQSTYGPEYIWLSSNLDAIRDSQIEEEDKRVILEALDWVTDVVRNPGQYMVERGISNIWTNTVLSGNPLRVEIGNQVITMNREITRKLKEFGYLDNEGKVIKAYYTRDKAWVEQKIIEHGGDI